MNARFSIPVLTSCLLLLVLPACDSSTDPAVSSDFFPALAVGNTISWDYKYEYIAGVSTLVEGLIGTMTWTITSAYDSSGIRVMTMRQEFNGLLDKHRSDTPYIRDTVWIQSDTTMGSISEVPNHTPGENGFASELVLAITPRDPFPQLDIEKILVYLLMGAFQFCPGETPCCRRPQSRPA